MLKLGELGEVSFRIYKLGELGEMKMNGFLPPQMWTFLPP